MNLNMNSHNKHNNHNKHTKHNNNNNNLVLLVVCVYVCVLFYAGVCDPSGHCAGSSSGVMMMMMMMIVLDPALVCCLCFFFLYDRIMMSPGVLVLFVRGHNPLRSNSACVLMMMMVTMIALCRCGP